MQQLCVRKSFHVSIESSHIDGLEHRLSVDLLDHKDPPGRAEMSHIDILINTIDKKKY